MDWLYTRWCQAARQLLSEDELGREVAVATRKCPESSAYLAGCAPELTPEQLELCLARGLPRTALAQWLAPHPKPLCQAAECLLLPLPELLERFGRNGLLRRLRRVVRAESLAHGRSKRPPGQMPCAATQPNRPGASPARGITR